MAAQTPAPDARDEQEGAAAEGEQQGRAGENDGQDLVDVAHDRALGADDLDRGRRGVLGRARRAGVVDRRVAGLGLVRRRATGCAKSAGVSPILAVEGCG